MITAAQEAIYLENNGVVCPLCGSDEITSLDAVNVGVGEATQTIYCRTCQEHWKDCYQLVSVASDDTDVDTPF